MPIDPTRIARRIKKERDGRTGYVLGVVPDGEAMPPPFREYLEAERNRYVSEAMAKKGATGAVAVAATRQFETSVAPLVHRRWSLRLHYYVASDPDGVELLREYPFVFPASAIEEGLLRTLLFPDGMRDLIPGVSEEDDKRCAVTQSEDPALIAGWWWTWNFTDYPHTQTAKMYRTKAEGLLPRTEGQ